MLIVIENKTVDMDTELISITLLRKRERRSASMSNIDTNVLKQFNIQLEHELRRLNNKAPPSDHVTETDIFIKWVCIDWRSENLGHSNFNLKDLWTKVGAFIKIVLDEYFIITRTRNDQVGSLQENWSPLHFKLPEPEISPAPAPSLLRQLFLWSGTLSVISMVQDLLCQRVMWSTTIKQMVYFLTFQN